MFNERIYSESKKLKSFKGIIDKIENGYSNGVVNDRDILIRKEILSQLFADDENYRRKTQQFHNLGLVNVALIGRNFSNLRLATVFFPGNTLSKMDIKDKILTLTTSPCDQRGRQDFIYGCPLYTDFSNLDTSFMFDVNYRIYPCFDSVLEFKIDYLSSTYEQCISLNFKEISKFNSILCDNDIVFYCVDKAQIRKELKYLEYLIKKSNLLKNFIKERKFFLIVDINKCLIDSLGEEVECHSSNSQYEYLNRMLGVPFIYELDLDKSLEEKIIYYGKIFYKMKTKFPYSNGTNHVLSHNNFLLEQISLKFSHVVKRRINRNRQNNLINEKIIKEFSQNLSCSDDDYHSYDLNILKEFEKEVYEAIEAQLNRKFLNLVFDIESKLLVKELKVDCNITQELVKLKEEFQVKIKENFDYIKTEILTQTNKAIKRYNSFLDNLNSFDSKGLVKKNSKKLSLLSQIFDTYGLDHYFTSSSIQLLHNYNRLLAKLYLKFVKLSNITNLTFTSQERDMVDSYLDLNLGENKVEYQYIAVNLDKNLKDKLNSLKFFTAVLFSVFDVKPIRYRPAFAYYNITNILGICISFGFFLKALRKYFKFKPKMSRIGNFLIWIIVTLVITFLSSISLNILYNMKSEMKLLRLIGMIKSNVELILKELNAIRDKLNRYESEYRDNALNILAKLINK